MKSYIEQLSERNFKQDEELKVDANELKRLASYALRKENECNMLKAKMAAFEVAEHIEKVRLYA